MFYYIRKQEDICTIMTDKIVTLPPALGSQSRTKTAEYAQAKAKLPKNIKITFHDTNNNNQLSPGEYFEYTTTTNERVVCYNPHVSDTPESVAQKTGVPLETIESNWRLKDKTKRDPNAFLTLTCKSETETVSQTTCTADINKINTQPDSSTQTKKQTKTAEKPFKDAKNGIKDEANFYNALSFKESSWKHNNKNGQYLGWFQLGKMALQDTGYMNKYGRFTGKDGINSENDFLNNKEVQKSAVKEYHKKLEKQIKAYGLEKYLGKTINGIEITESGMIAGAHLVGTKSLKKFLESNGKDIPKDGNDTPITEYIQNYGGYDLPDIDLNPPKKKK